MGSVVDKWERMDRMVSRILIVLLTIAVVILLTIFLLVIYGIVHYGG